MAYCVFPAKNVFMCLERKHSALLLLFLVERA
ncbi:GDT1-like protein 4 [Zea mays]|uniref:GDT1-like protein 4 n=1 Tax=Zea mays TaxID=4577 RepID=A0A1D6Q1H7_MAIZE|nr:GDT1-like protein 4 [Zea mays]